MSARMQTGSRTVENTPTTNPYGAHTASVPNPEGPSDELLDSLIGHNPITPRRNRHVQLRLFAETLYEGMPSDGKVHLFSALHGRKDVLRTRWTTTDPEKFEEAVRALPEGWGHWASVGSFDPDFKPVGNKRGEAKDVRDLRVLIGDLDFVNNDQDAAAHAVGSSGLPHPTELQVCDIIGRLREWLPPTMLVHSGHGYQLYIALSEPIPADDPRDLVNRWKLLLVREFYRAGVHPDGSVVADRGRVLRIPSTRNVKTSLEGPYCAILRLDKDTRYTLDEVDAALPSLDELKADDAERRKRTRKKTSSAAQKRPSEASTALNPTDYPDNPAYERLGRSVAFGDGVGDLDLSPVLEALYFEPFGSNDGDWIREGSTSGGKSLSVSEADDGDPLVHIWSLSLVRTWGLWHLQGDAGATLAAKDFLAAVCFPGETRAARDFLRHFTSDPDAGIAWLADRSHLTPAELAEQVRDLKKAQDRKALVDLASGERSKMSVSIPGVRGHVETISAPGSDIHGIWLVTNKENKDGESITVRERLLDLAVVISQQQREFNPTEGVMNTFDVAVVYPDGTVSTKRSLEAEELTGTRARITFVDTGAAFPVGGTHRTILSEAILATGARSRPVRVVWRHTGFECVANKWVWLAPAGSLTASGLGGPTPDLPIGVSSAEPLSRIGFDSVAEPADVPAPFRDFLDMTSAHPVLGIALLGITLAALLHARERGSVQIAAKSGSGKSLILSSLAGFWMSGAWALEALFTVDLQNDTLAAARPWMAFVNGYPILCDDFRSQETEGNGEAAMLRLNTAVAQAGIGNRVEKRAKQDGTNRARAMVWSPSISTGEKMSDAAGVINRNLVIPITSESFDHDMTNGRLSKWDTWRDQHFGTSARAALAAVIVWILGQMDSRTGLAAGKNPNALEALRDNAAKLAQEERALIGGNSRSSQIAGYIASGWRVLHEFCVAHNLDWTPDMDMVRAELRGLTTSSEARAEDATVNSRVLRALSDSLSTGMGHLAYTAGDTPQPSVISDAGMRASGWVRKTYGANTVWEARSGQRIGFWSDDHRWILIPVGVVSQVLPRLFPDLGRLGRNERVEAMTESCERSLMNFSNGRFRVTRSLGGNALEGWVIDPKLLNLGEFVPKEDNQKRSLFAAGDDFLAATPDEAVERLEAQLAKLQADLEAAKARKDKEVE